MSYRYGEGQAWNALVGLLAPAGRRRCRASGELTNFETGHVRPLAISPGGEWLFAVNTPDARLTVYALTPTGAVLATEVPVGLEPIAVASRVNDVGRTEAWVVNHLSDSVSVVEIDPATVTRSHVTRTLLVGDPAAPTYRYRAASGSDPIARVTVRPDRIAVSVKQAGFDYTLDEPRQGSIAIRLALGTALVLCADGAARSMGHPPTSARFDTIERFMAAPKAPAPTACPQLPIEG